MTVAFRGELVKKWGQAPGNCVILRVLHIGRRSQSPFFHKLGAKGDNHFPRMTRVGRCTSAVWAAWPLGFTRRNSSSNSAWRTFKLAGRVEGDDCGAWFKMLLQRQLCQSVQATSPENSGRIASIIGRGVRARSP